MKHFNVAMWSIKPNFKLFQIISINKDKVSVFIIYLFCLVPLLFLNFLLNIEYSNLFNLNILFYILSLSLVIFGLFKYGIDYIIQLIHSTLEIAFNILLLSIIIVFYIWIICFENSTIIDLQQVIMNFLFFFRPIRFFILFMLIVYSIIYNKKENLFRVCLMFSLTFLFWSLLVDLSVNVLPFFILLSESLVFIWRGGLPPIDWDMIKEEEMRMRDGDPNRRGGPNPLHSSHFVLTWDSALEKQIEKILLKQPINKPVVPEVVEELSELLDKVSHTFIKLAIVEETTNFMKISYYLETIVPRDNIKIMYNNQPTDLPEKVGAVIETRCLDTIRIGTIKTLSDAQRMGPNRQPVLRDYYSEFQETFKRFTPNS